MIPGRAISSRIRQIPSQHVRQFETRTLDDAANTKNTTCGRSDGDERTTDSIIQSAILATTAEKLAIASQFRVVP